jgi:two-component system chemotaxis response regulator CheB
VSAIRVLVVDDSVVIRRVLSDVLNSDPDFEVVGTAVNGRACIQRVLELSPDIVTLDVEMPEMDGIACLAELTKIRPTMPVIMFSTMTYRGAAATLDALALGAKDYVLKPINLGSAAAAIEQVKAELLPRIKALAGRRISPLVPPPSSPVAPAAPAGPAPAVERRVEAPSRPMPPGRGARPGRAVPGVPAAAPRRGRAAGGPVDIVAIGSSTGGPKALEVVLTAIGPDFPVPVVLVQHMPPVFTQMLAQRLDQKTRFTVVEATSGLALQPGHLYVAPGDNHMVVAGDAARGFRVELNKAAPENSCRPAVDVLFRSVAECFGARTLAVVLTGMGQDGLRGGEKIAAAGGAILAQDEASSVVWGMPGYVVKAGLADEVLAVEDVAGAIEMRVRGRRSAAAPNGRIEVMR